MSGPSLLTYNTVTDATRVAPMSLPLTPDKAESLSGAATAAFLDGQVAARTETNNPPNTMTNREVFDAGAATMLGIGGKNDFDVLRYPNQNLGMDEYPHYLMFFISERKSSIAGAQDSRVSTLNFDYSKNNQSTDPANSRVAIIGASTIGGGVAGQTAGQIAGSFSPVPGASKVLGATGAGIGAVVGTIVGTALAEQDRTRVLLRTAIALYLPHRPSVAYNAEWASTDLGIIGGLGKQLSEIRGADGVKDALKHLGTGVGGLAQSAIMTGASKFDTKGFGDVGGTLQSTMAQVPNPFRAQLFKAMGFRQFAFDYSFLPKNGDELREVEKIIYTFKRFMHPTLGKEKFIMSYPAEFTIAFYHKKQTNDHMFKISNCALTNVSVDYGGTDFTTFRNDPGGPSEISMRLSFVELEMMTRERIEDGY